MECSWWNIVCLFLKIHWFTTLVSASLFCDYHLVMQWITLQLGDQNLIPSWKNLILTTKKKIVSTEVVDSVTYFDKLLNQWTQLCHQTLTLTRYISCRRCSHANCHKRGNVQYISQRCAVLFDKVPHSVRGRDYVWFTFLMLTAKCCYIYTNLLRYEWNEKRAFKNVPRIRKRRRLCES